MIDRSYVVMDRLPGNTLNELTYRRPEILDDNQVTIAYQLGMHMAFSLVFGSRDGFQTNYVFDPTTRLLTRIDKESFFDLPCDPENVLSANDPYTQEIAACELANLKYIPSFRDATKRKKVVLALKQGFLDKYSDIKNKKEGLLQMVLDTRMSWFKMDPPDDIDEYAAQTMGCVAAIEHLIGLDPSDVFSRIVAAKKEFDKQKK